MRVGDEVVAIGNTLGLGDTPTVTTGIISGVGRSLDDGESVVLKELLQTDTAINPGNSGGPLVNSSGEVIGINTAIIDGADNVGFAIPVDRIKPLLDNIRNGGGTVRFDQPFLGVVSTGLDNVRAEVLEENDVAATQGVFILEITPRSAAATADLRVNDVIVAIDGETIATPDDVTRIIRSKSVGQTVAVTLDRQGETVEKAVELRARGEAGE
jgi:S1-C subfamily serine protease